MQDRKWLNGVAAAAVLISTATLFHYLFALADVEYRAGASPSRGYDAGLRPADSVIESHDPGAVWNCAEPSASPPLAGGFDGAGACVADYLAFPELAKGARRPMSESQLEKEFLGARLHAGPEAAPSMSEDELSAAIYERLNIDFLLRDFDSRPLRVAVTAQESGAGWEERRLLFRDPLVGAFPAILLLPSGPGPHPAILALHGHSQDSAKYISTYQAQRFAERGYAVLVPTQRAMNADAAEDRVTRTLLREGFSFMTLRVYEALLALKYLQARPDIRREAIGLIGHSGGSVVGSLVVRVRPAFAAFVVDFPATFYHEPLDRLIDENAPALFPYRNRVNDYRDACVPTLRVEYGYAGADREIFQFFDERLW